MNGLGIIAVGALAVLSLGLGVLSNRRMVKVLAGVVALIFLVLFCEGLYLAKAGARDIAKIVLGASSVACFLSAITRRNVVHSAVLAIIGFALTGALFIAYHAEFVGIVQIIITAGAIMVLYLFIVMLIDFRRGEPERITVWNWVGGALGGIAIVCGVLLAEREFLIGRLGLPEADNVRRLGEALYQTYAIPFEAVALVLFIAVVGTIIVSRRGGSGARDA